MCSSRRETQEFVGWEEPRSDMRASDADRERALVALRSHGAEGRLSPDELEQRVEAALNAQTHGELRELFSDLPSAPRRVARERRHNGNREHFRVYLAVSVLLVAIWALTGAGYFWPIWPIAGWGIVFLMPGCSPRRARRVPRGEAIRV
jgi:hypothetical protein